MIIASHIGGSLLDLLRAHASGPTVIDLTSGPRWSLPAECEMLVTTPAGWEQAPAEKPRDWPEGLRIIQTDSVGVDFYPPWIFSGTIVATAKGANAPSIAEYVLTAMLAHERPISDLTIHRAEDWRHIESGSLDGKTLGVAGYGSIGKAVAEIGKLLGMRVVVHRNSAWDPGTEGVEGAQDLAELFRISDHLVVAMPATSQTRGSIGRDVLRQAKPGLHLINVARGSLIRQEHLVEALTDGPLGFATLDVTDPEPLPAGHPLYTHPKVRLTPHVAWRGPGNARRFQEILLFNIEALADGRALKNVVDPTRGY